MSASKCQCLRRCARDDAARGHDGATVHFDSYEGGLNGVCDHERFDRTVGEDVNPERVTDFALQRRPDPLMYAIVSGPPVSVNGPSPLF